MRLGNNLPILFPDSSDLSKITMISTIFSYELGHDSEGLLRVDSELASLSKEVEISEFIGIDITASFVTDLSICRAISSLASVKTFLIAWMKCQSFSVGISFNDVDLLTASTIHSIHICHTINELNVVRALSIAISSPVWSSSLISWIS